LDWLKDSIDDLITRTQLLMFWGIVAAIFKMAAILKLSKANKIVNNNYSLQSGHKFTSIDQVSMGLNKKCQFTRGNVVKQPPFSNGVVRDRFFCMKVLELVHCNTVPIIIEIAVGVTEI
jgi:hypothetical protein